MQKVADPGDFAKSAFCALLSLELRAASVNFGLSVVALCGLHD